MYNNEITYDKKWETPENRNAFFVLEDRFFDRSECSPGCPVSWAKEVLELMNDLDKELGIKYNEKTLRGYYIKGNLFSWFLVNPIKAVFVTPLRYAFKPEKYEEQNVFKRLWNLPKKMMRDFARSFYYGFKAFRPMYLNKHLNKILNKKISLGQLKEKYGELTVYFNCNEAYRDYVDKQIKRCVVRLAIKGAYYPLESLYNLKTSYHVGNRYRPDVVITEPLEDGSYSLQRTIYREAMKDLGLDLAEIGKKADLMKK